MTIFMMNEIMSVCILDLCLYVRARACTLGHARRVMASVSGSEVGGEDGAVSVCEFCVPCRKYPCHDPAV